MDLSMLLGKVGKASATASALRHGCPHKKVDGIVRIDCQGCEHGQSLECPPCLRGALRILSNESGVKQVLLARDWEIAYDEDCVTALSSVAEAARFCSSLTFSLPFEDCPACAANPRGLIGRVMDQLPQGPGALGTLRAGPHGLACEQCVRTSRSNLDHISAILVEAERLVTRAAFRVVPLDERA